jgi:3-isopropylmalate dehydrogenase
MKLIILAGDGIGPEISDANIAVLQAASRRFSLGLQLQHELTGHASLKRYGTTVRPELLSLVKSADGLILGPTATADFQDESRGEINPSRFFRKALDLFANIRPARTYPGLAGKVGDFDLVVVRENTEGFYADRNIESGGSEMLITRDVVVSLRRITRECCTRLARSAFELAMTRRRQVSLVHKANVLRLGDGLFLECCHAVARDFPEVKVDEFLVDAMMAHVVRAPQRFDVIATTNMFGDILSDLTAELSGSLGLGGSLNTGHQYAMAQAAHGSAPDIAGRDIANPMALILSTAQLLAWLSQRHGRPDLDLAARSIDQACVAAISAGEVTADVGGRLGTAATGQALAQRILAS